MLKLIINKNKILLTTIFFISLYNYLKKIYNEIKNILKGIKIFNQYISNQHISNNTKNIKFEVIKLHPDEIFINKHKNIFKSKLEPFINSNELNNCELNKNISELYYNKFNEITLNNNELYLIWERRNIIINTPYGNVGMYYNLFHKGFSYYCDNKNIPNNILNCICMYYVLKYYCLNFYVDNTIITDWISPYWEVWFNEKNNEIVEKKPYIKRLVDQKNPILLPTNKKSIVKYKNYKLNKNNNIIYNKNIFIYGGKITDMLFFNKKKEYIKSKNISYNEFNNILKKNNEFTNLFI